MKLLFDQNLSPALAKRLSDLFPGSLHVWTIGLDAVPDGILWEYARINDFVLAGKDSDFEDMSMARGCPPKWIWVRSGNGGTAKVEAAFRRHFASIEKFSANPDVCIYVLR